MSVRPPGVLTEAPPDAAVLGDGWRPVDLSALPSTPFDLGERRLAVAAVVGDQESAAAVLLAAARGCAVVVRLALPDADAPVFLDDLGRLVDLTTGPPRPTLDADQATLLGLLADGLTVTAAAERLGWSRRSATRHLAVARDRLGVTTTAAAVRRFRQDAGGPTADPG